MKTKSEVITDPYKICNCCYGGIEDDRVAQGQKICRWCEGTANRALLNAIIKWKKIVG